MRSDDLSSLALLVAGGLALGVVTMPGAAPIPRHSRYLFVWAMEAAHPEATDESAAGLGRDFLAVFDVAETSSFGALVSTVFAGDAMQAHHTNYELPPDDVLYANDWMANRTSVFDLRDPAHPVLRRSFTNAGRYQYPHSFVHLSTGHTLATFQYADGFNKAPGGLVEFDQDGRVVRTGAAANPEIDRNIRPYSLAVAEALDRVVTGSADMMGAQDSHVVQVWRLSDLKLLDTIVLPKRQDWYYDDPANASEPRLLSDGRTVVVPTFNCGLYLVQDLAAEHPTLERIYDFGYRVCEVPVVVDGYLVEAMQSGHSIVSLDMRNPEHPREAGRIQLNADQAPHWIALEPGGDRLAITGNGSLSSHVLFARIDRGTGMLALDPRSIDFGHAWPGGWKGSAKPHGAVFSNR